MLVAKWFLCLAKYEKLQVNTNLCFTPYSNACSSIVEQDCWEPQSQTMLIVHTLRERPCMWFQSAGDVLQMGKRFMNYDDLKQFLLPTTYQCCFTTHSVSVPCLEWSPTYFCHRRASIAASAKGKIRFINRNTPYACMHACVCHRILARENDRWFFMRSKTESWTPKIASNLDMPPSYLLNARLSFSVNVDLNVATQIKYRKNVRFAHGTLIGGDTLTLMIRWIFVLFLFGFFFL